MDPTTKQQMRLKQMHEQLHVQLYKNQEQLNQQLFEKQEQLNLELFKKQEHLNQQIINELANEGVSDAPQAFPQTLPSSVTSENRSAVPLTPLSRLSACDFRDPSDIAPSVEPPKRLIVPFKIPKQRPVLNTAAQAPTASKENNNSERKEQAGIVTRSAGRKRHISLNSDDEVENDDADDTPNKPPTKGRLPHVKKVATGQKAPDRFAASNSRKTLTKLLKRKNFKTPVARKPTYPQVSALEKYATIIKVDDHVIELHCKFCEGNVSVRGVPIKGVRGMYGHIRDAHKRSYSHEWIVQNCIKTILMKSDQMKVENGTFVVTRQNVRIAREDMAAE